jgi:hypothetical protein
MALTSRRARAARAVDPERLAGRLHALGDRPAGSDAERRAARLLADELRASGRRATIETVWVRPDWHLALALGAGLSIAASLVSVGAPEVGLGLALAALLALVADLGDRVPALRLLTPSRATQNVVSPAPRAGSVRLIVTAATDVPRGGAFRRAQAWTGGRAPLVVLAAATGIAVAAGLRADGIDTGWLPVLQLLPTLVLLAAGAALLHSALVDPAAGENAGTGAALALALAGRLDARPPRNLAVEVVLAGAGDSAGAVGLAAHLRARRGELERADVAILHLEPGGAGDPCWWTGDGLLARLRMHPQLVGAAERVAAAETHLRAAPYRGRGATGALAARRRRLPALALGAASARDPVAAALDPAALRATLALALGLVAALDRELDGG